MPREAVLEAHTFYAPITVHIFICDDTEVSEQERQFLLHYNGAALLSPSFLVLFQGQTFWDLLTHLHLVHSTILNTIK